MRNMIPFKSDRRIKPRLAYVAATLSLAVAGAVGCRSTPDEETWEQTLKDAREAETNEQIVSVALREQIRNATESSGTLYPHYFVINGPELNPLGSQQFELLTATGRARELAINVPRGGISQELYEQRLRGLRQRLDDAGFDNERVKLVDQLPGGDGIPTEEVVQQAIKAQSERGDYGTGGTASGRQENGGNRSGGSGRGSGRAGSNGQ